jgi:hypothetical protein
VGNDDENRIHSARNLPVMLTRSLQHAPRGGWRASFPNSPTLATVPEVCTKTWLKAKCFTESKFVVVGTDRDRKTGALRALLARANEKGLDYVGAAFILLMTWRVLIFWTRWTSLPRQRDCSRQHVSLKLDGAFLGSQYALSI